ncbi:MAG: hypothetical protein ACOYOK_13800 [Pseudobdellovibrionaceae bacterium]
MDLKISAWIFYFLILCFGTSIMASPCRDLEIASRKAGCDTEAGSWCYRADNICYKGGTVAYSCEDFIICKVKERKKYIQNNNKDSTKDILIDIKDSPKQETFLKKCDPKREKINTCNKNASSGNNCYPAKNQCYLGGTIFYSCDDFVICETEKRYNTETYYLRDDKKGTGAK